MEPGELTSAIAFLVGSVGGASILILGLSSWLGKVWASRILEKDRATYQAMMTTTIEGHRDKVSLYQKAITPLIDMMVDIRHGKDGGLSLREYDRKRLQILGELSIFAPRAVLDEYRTLVHTLIEGIQSGKLPWERVQEQCHKFLDVVRKDVN